MDYKMKTMEEVSSKRFNGSGEKRFLYLDEIFKVYSMVMPPELERKYVDLTNAVVYYWSDVTGLSSKNAQIYRSANKLKLSRDRLEILEVQEKEMLAEFSKIYSEVVSTHSTESYKKLEKFSRKMFDFGVIRDAEKKKLEDKEKEYLESSNYISEKREGISELVSRISSLLESISKMDIDGKKRLDGIEVRSKHLEMLDKVDVRDEMKSCIKRALSSYVEMRKEIFRYVEALASIIPQKYNNRELVDFSQLMSADMQLIYLQGFMDLDDYIPYDLKVNIMLNPGQVDVIDNLAGHFRGEPIDEQKLKNSAESYGYPDSNMRSILEGLYQYEQDKKAEVEIAEGPKL